ncbi:hypothetical protein B0H14DRAFT_3524917 [Mycena olivaceomarginata]|nr:hypothetical protein B0H14DRAFT_3524917 [Mycena olivaceomarginata]
MDPSRSHYATRKSVREGRASPPTSLRSTSRATSPASHSSNARQLTKTNPVPTELLSSEVTTGLPRAPPSHGSQTSEVPTLTSDVDFNALNTVESQQDANGPWSTVTRKNSRTHSVRSASPGSGRELSSEDWVSIARCHQLIAEQAFASARKAGILPELPSVPVNSISIPLTDIKDENLIDLSPVSPAIP